MNENKLMTEEQVIRQLSGKEMEQVDGGVVFPNPDIKCVFCNKCFSTTLELNIHLRNCLDKMNYDKQG